MAEADDDERAEELDTLQSIYPELIIHPHAPYTATLELLVAPSKPLPTIFESTQEVHRLAYLPPLRLDIDLPPAYPSDAPPTIHLSTTSPWLPSATLQELTTEAKALWDEYGGGTILFSYISTLQERAETAFGLDELTLPLSLRQELCDFNQRMKRELFDKETFDCEVCLEPKKGSACYRMQRCSHVFCVACLQDYYNTCITEGEVNNVKCMAADCDGGGGGGGGGSKKERLLSPKELLQIPISRETVERYANIKRKKKIESDPSITFCPRSWCQGPMRSAKYPPITDVSPMDASDSEAEETVDTAPVQHAAAHDPIPPPGTQPATTAPAKRLIGTQNMDRLAICSVCSLAFCTLCLASWHGDFVRCEPRDPAQLTAEDQASLNFIMKSTTPCPYCSVPCQKSSGCNHMTCAQCKTHFCYLCSAWLDPAQPYRHFNEPRNKGCCGRLFDGAEGEEVQFGGRRGAEQQADFWEEARRIQMEVDAEVAAQLQ